jgi:large subunit ribosomal protein L6
MSRIGRKPITIPTGVKASIAGDKVTIAGAKSTLSTAIPAKIKVAISEADKQIKVSIDPKDVDDSQARASWGTTRALISNMIEGVTKGYEKSMEVVGVGWTAAVQGKNLKMTLGFANAIIMPIPQGLDVSVDKQFVTIKGPDKRMVGQFASQMRAKRKPEPYNGKGVKYKEEVIKKKQGKAFGG